MKRLPKPLYLTAFLAPSAACLKLVLMGALATGSLEATAGETASQGCKERRGPPPQAFEACADAQEGAVCEVQTRRGNLMAGQCKVPRRRGAVDGDNASGNTSDGEPLVCRPERRPGRGFRQHSEQDAQPVT